MNGILKKGKVVPLPNQVLYHEDVWGSGGLAQHILNISTSWRWVGVSCPGCFTLRERVPSTHWI